MIKRNIIRVSEFEKLYYDDARPFKQKHWEALCYYLENINKTGQNRKEYYRILKRGIQFTNYVGVIQAGNLTIEVLPKIDKHTTTAANLQVSELHRNEKEQKHKWHLVLLQMLRECRLLKVNHVDYANLNLKNNSILDIYIQLFLAEAQKLLHEGLLKKYRNQEGNQTALKGRLLFAKQIGLNSIHHERFYVSYAEYNHNNIYNQILYKTLKLISSISNSNHLIDEAKRLLLDFPEVSHCNVTTETFDRLEFGRKTERYKEAMLMSKMLLLNYRPDITGGAENVIAILFDMNRLWEEFVYRRLKREERHYDIKVAAQRSKNFWKSERGNTSKKVRPDILIEHSYDKDTKKCRQLIIDTKWKSNDELEPTDDDLQQMFIYNLHWKCEESVLLYPGNSPDALTGSYHHDLGYNCSVRTVSLFDEAGKLNAALGRTVLDMYFLLGVR